MRWLTPFSKGRTTGRFGTIGKCCARTRGRGRADLRRARRFRRTCGLKRRDGARTGERDGRVGRMAVLALAARRTASRLRVQEDFNPYPPPPAGVHRGPSERHFADYDQAALVSFPAPGRSRRCARLAGRGPAQAGGAHGMRTRRSFAAAPFRPRYHRLDGGLRRRSAVSTRQARARHSSARHREPGDRKRKAVVADAPVCRDQLGGASFPGARHVSHPTRQNFRGAAISGRQAAQRGYLAVCIEQSCFGERREQRLRQRSAETQHRRRQPRALLLGRCLARRASVADVSRRRRLVARRRPRLVHRP